MKNIKRLLMVGLVLYVLLLMRLIVFKYPDAMMASTLSNWSVEGVLRSISSTNFIPFKTIWDDLFNATLPVQLPNLIYNIAAFVPLGFLIPLIFERGRRLMVVLTAAFILSALLELIQIFTLLGTGDIDDVILNVFGAVLGYGLFVSAAWTSDYVAAKYRFQS